MEEECSPLNWDWYYQEEAQGIEELKHTLLYTTLELETTIARAHEEIARKGEELLQFKCLLSKTIKERDEAQLKCQRLVLENLILQQQIQQLEANNAAAAASLVRTTPTSYTEDDPFLGVDSSSGSEESFFGTQGTDYPIPPPQQQQLEVIDNVVLKKGLPEKGKFLQAVMEAGPLLQTLLLAGPLPQWQHPPPQLNSIEIPPVTIPSSSATTSRMLLHQDSCVSAIVGGSSGVLISRKRGLEQSCDGPDFDSAPITTNTKNQKVVHPSPLTNI